MKIVANFLKIVTNSRIIVTKPSKLVTSFLKRLQQMLLRFLNNFRIYGSPLSLGLYNGTNYHSTEPFWGRLRSGELKLFAQTIQAIFCLNNPVANSGRFISEDFSLLAMFLLVILFRGFFVVFSWLFRGPHLLGKTVFGPFSWFFRGFFVALVLGKFYAYSPWKSLLI